MRALELDEQTIDNFDVLSRAHMDVAHALNRLATVAERFADAAVTRKRAAAKRGRPAKRKGRRR